MADRRLNVRRILVIDDNADAADLLGAIMAMEGHVVEVAHGGREGLAAAANFLPDVVFLDIGMPGMDGYQVAIELRRNPSLVAVRIVALTAWGDAESRARVVECGFDAHLVKPAKIESLLNEAIFVRAAK